LQALKSYGDNYFDVAIVDPPYGLGDRLVKGGAKGGADPKSKEHSKDKAGNKELSKEEKKKWLENAECFNCGRKGHLAHDCDQHNSGNEEGHNDGVQMVGITIKEYVDNLCLHGGGKEHDRKSTKLFWIVVVR
jgi:hypothetical protein